MAILILEHLRGCSDTEPCMSCRVTGFVAGHFPAADLTPLVSAMRRATQANDQANLEEAVDNLEILPRAVTCLRDEGILTVGAVIMRTDAELLRLYGFGRKSLNDLKEALARRGLQTRSRY